MTETAWPIICGLLGKSERRGDRLRGEDLRLRIEGIFKVQCSGMRWRDLGTEYGKVDTVYRYYLRLCQKGVWQRILQRLAKEHSDHEYHMTDATITHVHQSAIGAKKGLQGKGSGTAVGV